MKKFFMEFKTFALKGNVMSLAVGVIIGAAFQGIVTSLTDNILSPLIGMVTRQNFDALKLDVFGVTLGYGAFLTALVNFFILAFVVFLMVRAMNKLLSLGERKEEEPPPDRLCPYCRSKLHEEATRCPACTSEVADR